jgi:hypothetical protein
MLMIPCETIDLSAYPDLVVIYLRTRVNTTTEFKTTEFKTLVGFGYKISAAVEVKTNGSF